MANIQIPNLPAVASMAGSELFEGVQSGSSVKISLAQIIAAARMGLPTTLPLSVSIGGTGSVTLTGYVKGSGTAALTASNTIPSSDIAGLGTMAAQNANAVAITGGSAALTGASSVTVSSASAALTVTQTGAGPSILVEDSASTDTSPFIVDANGNVGIGTSSPTSLLYTYSATSNNLSVVGDATTAVIMTRSSADANSPALNFRKNRGSTASPAAVANGDTVGLSNYTAYDGTTGLIVSSIQGVVETFTGVGDVSGSLRFSTRPTGAGSSSTERLRIASAGQFGIGGANYGTSGQTIVSGGAAAAPAWGAVGAAGGGTGITSYAIGDILFASGTTALSRLADVATGNALISGGVGVAPSYGKIGLTTHVSGTLPAANGGTGVTTAPAEAARIMGYTSTATAAGTTVLTNTNSQYQLFTGSTTQTITMPVTSTLTTGWTFHIVNNSTGSLTINASSGALICTVISGMTAMVTCISTAVTDATAWEFGFTDFGSVSGTGAVVLSDSATITNGALNGTVGATTPSTGSFTTVTAPTVTNAGTLSLTATGANVVSVSTNGVLRETFNSDGAFIIFQGNPTVFNASSTITGAVAATGIIQYTGGAATLTVDTGTNLDAYFSAATNMAIDFSIINTGGGSATVAVSTGVTSIGLLSVPSSSPARFRLRRTASATWIIYRIS